MSVIERISQLASERDISLFRLSALCGVDYRSLVRNSRKGYEPSLTTVNKFCLVLEISLADFFEGVVL